MTTTRSSKALCPGRACLACLAVFVPVAMIAAPATAEVFKYTDSALFQAKMTQLSLIQSTQDFEGVPAGTTISDPGSLDWITFSNMNSPVYGPFELEVQNVYGTTSDYNYLGVSYPNPLDVLFIGGDEFDMAFGSSHAIGLFIITGEDPVGDPGPPEIEPTIYDADVQLVVGTETAYLDVDNVQDTLLEGGLVYFLGVIDDTNTFSTAGLRYAEEAIDATTFNIDDITRGSPIPEPSAVVGLSSLAFCGLVAGVWRWRKRRNAQTS